MKSRCRGSSFDGFQYSGRAQEMKVLERYEQMMADHDLLEYRLYVREGDTGRDGDSFLRVPREEYVVLGLDRS